MDTKKLVLGFAVAAAALGCWMGRYTVIAVPAGGEGIHGIAYRLDRWTGDIAYVMGQQAGSVEIKKDQP